MAKTEERNSTILSFLKFGSEENLNDLLRNGNIFMNSIQYFRQIEDKELRGDSYEGASRIINYPPGEFEIPEIGFKGNYLNIHIREAYEEVLGNIFSLYCISSHGWGNPTDFKIDQRIKRFGTHCVMIKDNERFFNLMKQGLNSLNLKYDHGFVDYYNRKEINRKVSLFEKPLEFEYQKEFRFYVDRNASDSFQFRIGNIEDIAEIYPIESVVDTLELVHKSR